MLGDLAAWSAVAAGLVLGAWALRTIARALRPPRDAAGLTNVSVHAAGGVASAAPRDPAANTPTQTASPAPRWPEPARTAAEEVATWQRSEAAPNRPVVEHTLRSVRLCGACRDGVLPGKRLSGYLLPQHAVQPARYRVRGDWPLDELATLGVRPAEIRCVQAKCRRDKPLAPDALQKLSERVDHWRQRYPVLADCMIPTLAAWRDCVPQTHAAAEALRIEIADFCQPVDMPRELARPHVWETGDEFPRQLGDWYEGVLAWSFEQCGYEVYWRGKVMGKRDGGVDIVCVRW